MKPKHAILYINISLILLSFCLILMSLLNSMYLANISLIIGVLFSLLLLWNFTLFKGIVNKRAELESAQEPSNFIFDENSKKLEDKVLSDQNSLLKKIKNIDAELAFKENLELRITTLANSIGLVAGLCYQLEQNVLNLVNWYALEKENHKAVIKLGQGITGEVAQTGIPVTLDIHNEDTDIDATIQMDVFSGLGQSKPNYLHVLPIFESKNIVGVVELATFQKMTEEKVDFLIEALRQ